MTKLNSNQIAIINSLSSFARKEDAREATVMNALAWDQVARNSDKIAGDLRAVLGEARHEHELSLLAHATSTDADRDEALRLSVAASAAVDVALHAVTSYVAHGFYYPASPRGPEETPLHERCRLARNAIDAKIAEVFAAHHAEAS